ncbi:thioesterase family protein [Legionella sp. km772]|uniref:acyl-CoA thioesterase n=1 Tax=Legionella sp. km772 TaxID=2498111 RepID=UPI000F8F747F|nr:thioesterase family protein [Legionella sp. km772]RUR13110.1 acyl-CoA thioesterase [Legionella sp. km772]
MSEKAINIHEKTFAIAWGDMDALGHVNNSRYLDYFQEARIEWLKDLNLPMTGTTGPVVIQVSATFLKPVVYPATLTLRSSIHSIGNSSMVMDHHLYQGEILMSHGMSKIVWVDYAQGKSVPLPDIIRSLVKS